MQFNENNPVISSLDLKGLVEGLDMNKIFTYDGSLTTPTCDEIINWVVVNDPQPISQAQLDSINARWKGNLTWNNDTGNGNNRMTMPINQRNIYKRSRDIPFAFRLMVANIIFLIVFVIIGFLFDWKKIMVFYKDSTQDSKKVEGTQLVP